MCHGSRPSYVAGCRCAPCRAANAAAAAAHRRAPVGTVDATEARTHLAALVALGLGTRQIARLSSTSRRTVAAVLHGTQTTLRPATAAALLGARPVLAHGATVAATKTWRYIDSLQREGFTRRELAFRLGAHSQQLQLHHRRVTVASALKVSRLYQHLTG